MIKPMSLDENQALVMLDFPELETEKQWNELLRRPECYMANQIRPKRVEISERHTAPVEKRVIQEGKQAEIKEFLQERVVSMLTEKDLKTGRPEDVMKI